MRGKSFRMYAHNFYTGRSFVMLYWQLYIVAEYLV